MTKVRHAVAATALAWAVVAAGGPAAAQSTPRVNVDDPPAASCQAIFGGSAFSGLPVAGEIGPGQPLSIDVSWGEDASAAERVSVLGCVAVDGELVEGLATAGRRVRNDGHHILSVVLPTDLPAGAAVCQRSALLSPVGRVGLSIQRAGGECYTVASGAGQPGTAPARETASAGAPPAAASPPPSGENVGAGATEERAAAPSVTTSPQPGAAAPDELGRTGAGSRALGALAGLLLVVGGMAVGLGSAPHAVAVRQG